MSIVNDTTGEDASLNVRDINSPTGPPTPSLNAEEVSRANQNVGGEKNKVSLYS
jgi:hypothetical protein